MRRLILEQPVAQAAVWSRRLALFAVATTGVAIALSRAGAVEPLGALAVFGAAMTVASLAILLAAAAAVVIWRTGRRGAGLAAAGLLLALALMAYPAWLTAQAILLPPINQVSTDPDSPPAYMLSAKARMARAGATPPAQSPAARAAQRIAYPKVQPVLVDLEAAQAYQLALRIARDLGWRVVDSTPPNLRDGVAHIDAIDRSLLFGFADDIAIRIQPLANQTRIDLRSSSRIGRHDFGANARRIERFIAAAQDATQDK